jgi:hypothetical protein
MSNYTSPTNSRRGCLCADGKKYSKDCCKGKLINQGIGSLKNQSSFSVYDFNSEIITGKSFATWGYKGYEGGYPAFSKFGQITNKFWGSSEYEIQEISMEIYPERKLRLVFYTEFFPNVKELVINNKSFLASEGFEVTVGDKTQIVWSFGVDDYPFEDEEGIKLEVKGR